jgi:hypothetical protein
MVNGFGFLFFCAFWLWVVRIFLGLVLFLVVGVVFLCWFFCIGWLGLVRVISSLGKGTIRNGIREFRRQIRIERFAKQQKESMRRNTRQTVEVYIDKP